MTESNPQSWQRIESLFHGALAVTPESREEWLREATGGDEGIIAEVMALIAADSPVSGPGMISRIVAEASPPAPSTWVGRDVGPYRLTAELGHGGMGTVYLAERNDQAYHAKVAIKFVRGSLAGPALLRRLVSERQILADLTHPNIARLLDGGTAPDGTPYIVMEHIEGAPIDRHCAHQRLDLPARLRLFLRVTAAVQHAHQALIVHRDLKPSNILVTRDGIPKLVDFGIAKLLEGSRHGAEDETLTGMQLMTPAYASPEQLRAQRITVATDIYALGVVLYQLVAGRHPLGLGPETPLPEIIRRVTEDEPPPPSAAATGLALSWRKALAGDLDAILLKALAQEPERRYSTVEQLARDLSHYLAGEPVLARPATLTYRVGKFIRRHRTAVTATGLVLLALTAGLGTALWQRGKAVRARGAAVQALEQSNATRQFLLSLFRANDPSRSGGREVTARELLDRGIARVDSLEDRPALQAELLYVLGRIQLQLGSYRSGADLLRRSVDRYRALPGRDTQLVSALTTLGNAMSDLGWPDSAAHAWQAAVDHGSAAFGPESPEILAPIGNLGVAYNRMGDQQRAETAYLRTIALERRVLGEKDRNRIYAIANLALLYSNTGRFGDATPLFKEALGIARSQWGNDNTVTGFALDNYGVMLRDAGRYDEAEPLLREGLALRSRLLGPDHRFTAESYLSLGSMLAHRGRGGDFREADSLLTRALAVYRARLTPNHPACAYVMHALGVLAYNQGQLARAEHWFREALTLRRASTRRDGPAVTVQTLTALGHALRDHGSAEALTTFRAADSLARLELSPDHPFRLRAAIGYALSLEDRGQTTGAEALFREGVAALSTRIGREHPYVLRACARGRKAGLVAASVCLSEGQLPGRRF